ncbi:MAG: hypothetical protein A2504_10895 [Bdellovibrionales bacterium RIFOXYD12_FULL_39_22]|nr:MAG: hypothetical protein A2385_09460 [Bdellovibrionales bacterium RIFOXYB1_FULL_39_21]OFZ44186.1 MAG: hypothetical protein A2485_07080 [Bdellovibrionales bacterium RIFOXYC12_FULL_39_17]OFZ46728.1 MAG: hypothetical protein A2404_04315 [Bdellovibrionales bacterium RIFOXYC1_FULL_39_130]OFZ74100.1 MAG: hypothetical protein A2451_11190 [Bdellovibrionales bacterium RIFOXYC2_FULL_39_8]OFZ75995.1 MAG: hypothetical protein A2560_02835 [Bdellovibrionales bacterium RIFOXYD1_FULL_39_84]OFZ95408.1 MAG:
MDILKKSLFLLAMGAFFFAGCGANLRYKAEKPKNEVVGGEDNLRPNEDERYVLNYKVSNLDGGTIDLADDDKKFSILLFSTDTCETCVEETQAILQALQDRESPPANINLLTILVAVYPEDAIWWRDIHKIPWAIGLDEQAKLFKLLCAENTVPCIVVNDPAKGIVLRHHGIYSVDKLKEITGKW